MGSGAFGEAADANDRTGAIFRAAHLLPATSATGVYSKSYGAAGNMTCRAPTSSTTCKGSSPTGQGLSYDNEGQLIGWISALHGSPTPSTAAFAYDVEGSRVALKATTGSDTTSTTTTTRSVPGALRVLGRTITAELQRSRCL